MATPIILPKQGLQMTEGTITKWLAREGEKVALGQPLFEMETDKLTITIDSAASGTLLKIIHGEFESVPVAGVVAFVGEPGEDVGAAAPSGDPRSLPGVQAAPAEQAALAERAETAIPAAGRTFASPRAKTAAQASGVDVAMLRGSGPDGLVVERDVLSAAKQPKATPVARKEAELAGVPLASIAGSGINGKITKADVLAQLQPQAASDESYEELTGMRRAIWENMMASCHGMAQARMTVHADMSGAIAVRRAFEARSVAVSYNDILIRALCRALLEHPELNSRVEDGRICRKRYVNMGLAVAVERGLIVPTIRNAHEMTLQQLHAESAELVDKARKGTLTREEYSGGTFTLSNLGMFGIDSFDAIINPPQAGILAVGRVKDTPVAQGGQVVIRPMCALTLTYDHRIVDGAPAARFLQRVAALVEDPALML